MKNTLKSLVQELHSIVERVLALHRTDPGSSPAHFTPT